jgi:hypothetical protein
VIRDSLENPDHFLVLNTLTGASYEINNTGRKILECCNGTLAGGEIAKKVAGMEKCKKSKSVLLMKDITEYFKILLREGIIEET